VVAAVTNGVLSLDSPRWAELMQAYGTAEDVPRLLEALACIGREDARAEVWFALWRTLHRSGEVFTASYAAAPHLLAIGGTFGVRERAEAAHLVTRIEASRRAPASPPMPTDLVEGYAHAVDSLPAFVAAGAAEPWPAEVAQIFAAALLVGKRQPELARGVLELGRALTCPTCGTDYVTAAPRD
jgi:hypothetical protein